MLLLAGGTTIGAAAGLLTPHGADASVRIDITQGNVQPIPIALPDFVAGAPGEAEIARNVTAVITNDLKRSGLFAPISPQAYIEKITNTDSVPRFAVNGIVADFGAEVLRDAAGNEIPLRPQAFAVLRHLAENPDRLVRKDELGAAVWRGVAVTDDSLVQCIGEIRRAIGDEATRC